MQHSTLFVHQSVGWQVDINSHRWTIAIIWHALSFQERR